MNQQQTNNKIISWISLGVVSLFAFMTPILFTPTPLGNPFDLPKWVFFVTVAVLMMVIYGISIIINKQILIPSKEKSIAILGLFLAVILSIWFGVDNKIVALMGKGSLIISMLVIVFTSITLLNDKFKLIIYPTILSIFLLSITQILAVFDLLSKIHPMLSNKYFTPAGTQLSLIYLLVTIIPLTILMIIRNKNIKFKIILSTVILIQLIALIISISNILPGQTRSPKILPLKAGWSIAVDQLKITRTAFIGSGIDNFTATFNQLRPAYLNLANDWGIKYGASSNEYLTIFTTMGLLGLVSFIFYLMTLLKIGLKKYKESHPSPELLGLLILVILITITPANIMFFYLLTILSIIIWTNGQENYLIKKEIHATITGLFLVFIGLIFLIPITKVVQAEYYFNKSLNYASQNRGKETYENQIKAISKNPYMSKYRISYSNTNLALANTLAGRTDISDEDKKKISQLINQAVREAKAAVALDPDNAFTWLNLAQIYRQLTPILDKADEWTIQTYVQAIRLDRTNPKLRVELAGFLLNIGNPQEAIKQLNQAIQLKPNYANAYYNLSYAYKGLKQYPQAYLAMQKVLTIINPDTEEYSKANEELKQLYELIPDEYKKAANQNKQNGQVNEKLTKPEASPSPNPNQVNLQKQEEIDLSPPELEDFDVKVDEASGSANTEINSETETNDATESANTTETTPEPTQ